VAEQQGLALSAVTAINRSASGGVGRGRRYRPGAHVATTRWHRRSNMERGAWNTVPAIERLGAADSALVATVGPLMVLPGARTGIAGIVPFPYQPVPDRCCGPRRRRMPQSSTH
jgi:hypothetical protein